MLEDVYFLIGLPMLGVVSDLTPMLSRGETLEELCDRHYYATAYVCSSYILMCDIEDLSTQVVETLLQRIIDVCGLMVSLFVYVYIGPRPPPRHQRRVVAISHATVSTGSSCRKWWEMDGVLPYLEQLATRASDDG